jgi:hypothetical protein
MSSNMSRRRRLEPPPPLEPLDPPLPEPELPPLEELLPVEYFVEVLLPESWVRTSVPKSVQFSQTSSSAPSTFTVLGDDVSAPHISH